MPRAAGADVFRISVRGAGAIARDFDRMARQIQDEVVAELRYLGRQVTPIFQNHAPRDTGQLHDAIVAVPYFRARRPRLSVRVRPLVGHGGDTRDYLDVTRYGHRKRIIEPKRGRFLKVHLEGHRSGAYTRMTSVAGVRVSSDWVENAGPEIDREMDQSAERLGRRIEARVIR